MSKFSNPNTNPDSISYRAIGTLHTPWTDEAPYQASPDAKSRQCSIVIYPEFQSALKDLDGFSHLIVLFHCHRIHAPLQIGEHTHWHARPPWLKGSQIGTFASRSPDRPNPIGLSIVKLLTIVDGTLMVSTLDAFNGTPVLDIKPYIPEIDSHPDAHTGWLAQTGSQEHLQKHIQGIPHQHE